MARAGCFGRNVFLDLFGIILTDLKAMYDGRTLGILRKSRKDAIRL